MDSLLVCTKRFLISIVRARKAKRKKKKKKKKKNGTKKFDVLMERLKRELLGG